jgi:hypothetical protein
VTQIVLQALRPHVVPTSSPSEDGTASLSHQKKRKTQWILQNQTSCRRLLQLHWQSRQGNAADNGLICTLYSEHTASGAFRRYSTPASSDTSVVSSDEPQPVWLGC